MANLLEKDEDGLGGGGGVNSVQVERPTGGITQGAKGGDFAEDGGGAKGDVKVDKLDEQNRARNRGHSNEKRFREDRVKDEHSNPKKSQVKDTRHGRTLDKRSKSQVVKDGAKDFKTQAKQLHDNAKDLHDRHRAFKQSHPIKNKAIVAGTVGTGVIAGVSVRNHFANQQEEAANIQNVKDTDNNPQKFEGTVSHHATKKAGHPDTSITSAEHDKHKSDKHDDKANHKVKESEGKTKADKPKDMEHKETHSDHKKTNPTHHKAKGAAAVAGATVAGVTAAKVANHSAKAVTHVQTKATTHATKNPTTGTTAGTTTQAGSAATTHTTSGTHATMQRKQTATTGSTHMTTKPTSSHAMGTMGTQYMSQKATASLKDTPIITETAHPNFASQSSNVVDSSENIATTSSTPSAQSVSPSSSNGNVNLVGSSSVVNANSANVNGISIGSSSALNALNGTVLANSGNAGGVNLTNDLNQMVQSATPQQLLQAFPMYIQKLMATQGSNGQPLLNMMAKPNLSAIQQDPQYNQMSQNGQLPSGYATNVAAADGNTYHSQRISGSTFNNILSANNRPGLTSDQINAAAQANQPLVNGKDNIAFTGNVYQTPQGDTLINQSSIQPSPQSFNYQQEKQVEQSAALAQSNMPQVNQSATSAMPTSVASSGSGTDFEL